MISVQEFLTSVYRDYIDIYNAYKKEGADSLATSLEDFLSKKEYLSKDLAMAYSYLLGVCDALEEINSISITLSGYQEKEYDIPVIKEIMFSKEHEESFTLRMEDYLND